MKNREETILSELKELLDSLKSQVADIESRIAELEEISVAHASSGAEKTPEAETLPSQEKVVDFTSPVMEELPVEELPVEDLPVEELPVEEPVAEETPSPAPLVDEGGAQKAVIDVMSAKERWRTDRPGSEVHDIRSAITLNDRVLFINSLFDEDPMLFQETLTDLNGMEGLADAVTYISSHFQQWDMESETVYRFMMAVRRRIRK